MSLDSSPRDASGSAESKDSLPSLSSAIEFLQSLRPRILDLLENKQLLVPLEEMDIMKPDRGDPEKAHVLWVGPRVVHKGKGKQPPSLSSSDSEGNDSTVNKLVEVCSTLFTPFSSELYRC